MKVSNTTGVFRLICITIILSYSIHSCSSDDDSPPDITDPPGGTNNSRIVGSSHVKPMYVFGSQDCLNEGADYLLNMGTKVIKIWYYYGGETAEVMYPWNSSWTPVNSLVEGLDQQHFIDLFNKPFETFAMNIASFGISTDVYYWRMGISQAQEDQEELEFYEFTKALLTKYEGTGKTFLFQHHEGDWHTRGHTDGTIPASDEIHTNMIKWLNARQRGVTKARNEINAQDVFVYHAAEVNIVVNAMRDGQPNIVNAVLPFTNLDMVSYSAWDSCLAIAANDGNGDGQIFEDAMLYLKSQMPDSDAFGNENVYCGEYGVPEGEYTNNQIDAIMKNTVEVSFKVGSPYIIYWNAYDNELSNLA
ncbi:MAG: hypothetical protein KAG14_04730, partial [Mycoplasmataceae bacterium]|nr:hypothetical protein [Mycoplasmataceae bacterium]